MIREMMCLLLASALAVLLLLITCLRAAVSLVADAFVQLERALG